MLSSIRQLIGDVYTPITEYAAIHVQLYLVAYINRLKSTFSKFKLGLCHTMLIAQILQFTLPSLVADWTVQRVIDQEKFYDTFSGIQYFRRRNILYLHAVHYRRTAGSHQLRHRSRV